MQLTTIGLDLAKHVFQVHGVDTAGNIVLQAAPPPRPDDRLFRRADALPGPVTAKMCELAIGEEPSWINCLALRTPRSPGSRSRFSDRAWHAGD